MPRPAVLTPEEDAELRLRWAEYLAARHRADMAARENGLESAEFKEADAEAGNALRKMKALLGTTGQHWME
jgi:hypothetical protein